MESPSRDSVFSGLTIVYFVPLIIFLVLTMIFILHIRKYKRRQLQQQTTMNRVTEYHRHELRMGRANEFWQRSLGPRTGIRRPPRAHIVDEEALPCYEAPPAYETVKPLPAQRRENE